MKRPSLQSRKTAPRRPVLRRIAKPALILLMLGLAVFWVMTPLPEKRIERAEPAIEEAQSNPLPARANTVVVMSEDAAETPAAEIADGTLTPRPMQLTRKVLLDKEWNSAPDALGQTVPLDSAGEIRDGSFVGPNAVAFAGSSIYVLDSSGNRLAVYDQAGQMLSSVPLPGTSYGDLVVNPTDSSLFVIDHLNDNVFKVRGDEVSEFGSISLMEFSLGLKFGYDERSGTLYVHDYEIDADVPLMVHGQTLDAEERVAQTLSPVRGDFEEENRNNIHLKFRDGQEMRIAFDRPVQCVEEMVMDPQGIVWVLFTLDGDFRMRRLARVDPVAQTVGVAPLDVFFLYDSTRHMAPSGNGIVIVAGDGDVGRLLSFEYAGL